MKFGGYTGLTLSVCRYVCLSVCLCVTKSCAGHNFKSIKASNFKLHTQVILCRSAVYNNRNSIPTIFGIIAVCKF